MFICLLVVLWYLYCMRLSNSEIVAVHCIQDVIGMYEILENRPTRELSSACQGPETSSLHEHASLSRIDIHSPIQSCDTGRDANDTPNW